MDEDRVRVRVRGGLESIILSRTYLDFSPGLNITVIVLIRRVDHKSKR